LITTPIGLAIGLYEGWKLAGGLVFVMATFIAFLGFAFLTIVLTIRRERRQEEEGRLHHRQCTSLALSVRDPDRSFGPPTRIR